MVALSGLPIRGVFHLVNGGQCSWYELASKIAELSGFDPERIAPIATEEWPSPAPRPAWSVLDCSRAYASGIVPMRPWQAALADFLGVGTTD